MIVSITDVSHYIELAPGEEKTVEFTYGAPNIANLGSCEKYTARAWVCHGPRIVTQSTQFTVGTAAICEQTNKQLTREVVSGEIAQGETVEVEDDLTVAAKGALKTTASLPGKVTYLLSQTSDLDLHLYDLQGHHVGVNYQTGEVENQISNATYSGPVSDPEIITLLRPTDQTYKLKVVGVKVSGTTRFKVLAVETPPYSAMLNILPIELNLSASPGEIIDSLAVSVTEFGGQHSVEDFYISTTDLISEDGRESIFSSAIIFANPPLEIPRGATFTIGIKINIPWTVTGGKRYTGTFSITGKDTYTDKSMAVGSSMSLSLIFLKYPKGMPRGK